jgi:hypothetical protein
MLTIERYQDAPYQWGISAVALEKVANAERKMPLNFVDADGFHITEDCRRYLLPLIQGEAYPPYRDGLPHYSQLKYKSPVIKTPTPLEEESIAHKIPTPPPERQFEEERVAHKILSPPPERQFQEERVAHKIPSPPPERQFEEERVAHKIPSPPPEGQRGKGERVRERGS